MSSRARCGCIFRRPLDAKRGLRVRPAELLPHRYLTTAGLERHSTRETRTIRLEPCGTRDQCVLDRHHTIDEPEADVANGADWGHIVREQAVEIVGDSGHQRGVEAAPLLITIEHVGRAVIQPEPHCIYECFGECRDVLEAKVETLAGEGMDDMRGIADEGEARRDELARQLQAEREGLQILFDRYPAQ